MVDKKTYEIHVEERLDEKWAVYFAPFKLILGVKGTIITGEVRDQAELFGVLIKIRDSGLKLVSICAITDS